MLENFCILFTGKIDYLKNIKNHFKDSKIQIIFSTWKGNEIFFEEGDLVVFNEIPNEKISLNFQKTTILSGLYEAKKLGFKKILKLRDDLIPTNIEKFLELINNQYINLLCWHGVPHNSKNNTIIPGYFVDYLISGEIEELIEIYSKIDINIHLVPEIPFTKSLLNYSHKINFFLKELNENNDLFWYRIGNYISTYNQNLPEYKDFIYVDDYNEIKETYNKL